MFKITIKISLKFVPKSPINNIPALVQIMSWCRQGDKAIFSTNDGLHYWCIYASLGPNYVTEINLWEFTQDIIP